MRLEVEEFVEADYEVVEGHDAAGGEDDAGHVAVAAGAVLAEGEGLPKAAEEDFLVGYQAGQPDRVDRDSPEVAAAGAFDGELFGLRDG